MMPSPRSRAPSAKPAVPMPLPLRQQRPFERPVPISWRKRLGVEPSPPREEAATDFEDREGHRAPVASAKNHNSSDSTRSVSERSSRTTSAPAAASSSRVWPPVVTAIDRAPAAAAQATSCGVSPMTIAC